MIEQQLKPMGIRDPIVLEAMETVPREAFVDKPYRSQAYDDTPLPIEAGQTISQPFIVAYMVESLQLSGGEKVLEVGTGSGYAAAVLAEIAAEVVTIERIETLAESAKQRLAELGYDNVHCVLGDGSKGCPQRAPYDAIVVSAGAPAVPEALKAQLAVGGRLILPVGGRGSHQQLWKVTRVNENEYLDESFADVRFVPLVGDQGWQDDA
jgi:protein-L-isoaspartate(D-aspartate) O-methyltransferase